MPSSSLPHSLPQHDPQPTARADALAAKREHYFFAFDLYHSLAMSAKLPKGEGAEAGWSALMNKTVAAVVGNDLRADQALSSRDNAPQRVAELKVALGSLLSGQVAEAGNDLVAAILAGPVGGTAKSLDAFRSLFRTVPPPALADTFQDDGFFARKVLAGSDPEILERVTARNPSELDPKFPFTEAQLQAVSPGDDLSTALAEKRVFVADYGMLDGLEPNDLGGRRRWVFAPRVAYVVSKGDATLKAFAIQVGREPGPQNPIFTPADGWGWMIAKTHVSVADTIAGAIWFHHARTHLVAEPMIVAAHRQLAPNHPLMTLLEPHFAGTLNINSVGFQTVFAPHGILDWFTGATRDSIRRLALRSVQEFRFDDSIFPRRLALRGVDDEGILKDFPYRDDGLLVWNAIRSWVGSYVETWYASDAEVLADVELQAWLSEITAPDGGGIQGIGEAGAFRTRAYLSDVLSQVIFSGSATHAAMNFPVLDEMTFVPNSPFGAYAPAPTRVDGWTEADWLEMLPTLDQAQRQLDTAWVLGAMRYGSLGGYPSGHFTDPRVVPLLQRHLERLDEVEQTIDRRNTTRPPYVHLKPSRIPPGINI